MSVESIDLDLDVIISSTLFLISANFQRECPVVGLLPPTCLAYKPTSMGEAIIIVLGWLAYHCVAEWTRLNTYDDREWELPTWFTVTEPSHCLAANTMWEQTK